MQIRLVELTSNTITRPSDTTTYTNGDLLANSTSVGSVTPFSFTNTLGRGLVIKRLSLLKSSNVTTNASFRVWLYKDVPVTGNGDNGIFGTTTDAGIFGTVPIATGSETYVSTSVFAQSTTPDLYVYLDADQTFYALIQMQAAYVPTAAETFTLKATGLVYIP